MAFSSHNDEPGMIFCKVIDDLFWSDWTSVTRPATELADVVWLARTRPGYSKYVWVSARVAQTNAALRNTVFKSCRVDQHRNNNSVLCQSKIVEQRLTDLMTARQKSTSPTWKSDQIGWKPFNFWCEWLDPRFC